MNPRDAKVSTQIDDQTLALADNLDAPANVFLGRELTATGTLNDAAMESATRKVISRLNPNFKNFKMPVLRLSGGQRQWRSRPPRDPEIARVDRWILLTAACSAPAETAQ